MKFNFLTTLFLLLVFLLSSCLNNSIKNKESETTVSKVINYFTIDLEHNSDINLQKEKQEVLSVLEEFDTWYKYTNKTLVKVYSESKGEEYWYYVDNPEDINSGKAINNIDRKKLLTSRIYPEVKKFKHFTKSFQDKIASNNQAKDDLGNLGVILTNDDFAKYWSYSLITENWYVEDFSTYVDPENEYNLQLPESKKKYNLFMIHRSSNQNYKYSIMTGLIFDQGKGWKDHALVFDIIKTEQGVWKINDIRIERKSEIK